MELLFFQCTKHTAIPAASLVILVCGGFLSTKCHIGQGLLDRKEAEERAGGTGAVVSLILTISCHEWDE